MARFGFVGASYASQSPNADAESCVNWYVESIESTGGKSALALYPTPGLKLLYTLPGSSVSQIFTFNGRSFAVSGGNFCELFASSFKYWGAVKPPTTPASITAGPNQILIASGGNLYVFDLTANALTPVDMTTLVGPVIQVAYCDGFFIALFANSNEFQVSTPDDATSWNLTDVDKVSVFPDNVTGMSVIYRQLFMFGNKQGTVYYDSGNIFPFDIVSGGFIEQGAVNYTSISVLDNSLFWMGQDSRGALIAWRANGYSPVRISNHAVEFAWQGYQTISDVISYAYQDQGHTFWVVYFPTASKTWVYDAATGMWHERKYGEGTLGTTAHRSQCHTYNFGMHIVGDWATGNVYQMSIPKVSGTSWAFCTDFGTPIRRVRRAPHISSEQEWIFHHKMQVDLETGLGPIPPLLDGQGNPRDPQVILKWSDDGGHTWSNEHYAGVGQAGKYLTRVIWRSLGRSRSRIYELIGTDPIPYRVIEAYLDAEPGFTIPSERLTKQIGKIT